MSIPSSTQVTVAAACIHLMWLTSNTPVTNNSTTVRRRFTRDEWKGTN
eukprot:gene35440-47635_t